MEIKELYSRGLDAVQEGAGLDYLLPTALLRYKALWYDRPVFERFLTENRNFPHLGACFTFPRLVATSPPTSDNTCSYKFRVLNPDRFDTERRNDSYLQATQLDWSSYYHPILTIDDGPNPAISYAGYVGDTSRPLPGDRDYFIFNDNKQTPIVVTVSAPIELYVDNQEAPLVGNTRRITVPAKERHTILVQSDYPAGYRLSIAEPLTAIDQSVESAKNRPIRITLQISSRLVKPAIVDQPQHGTLLGLSCHFTACVNFLDGLEAPQVTYEPEHSYSGQDSFTFKAETLADGIESNIATVSIHIF